MANKQILDSLRRSVETASGGKQTILYSAKGQPQYMNIINAYDSRLWGESIGIIGKQTPFVDGVNEIFVGTYQGIVKDGEILSQPMTNPNVTNGVGTASYTLMQLAQFGQSTGAGFHLMTNDEWMAVAYDGLLKGGKGEGNRVEGKGGIDGSTGMWTDPGSFDTLTGSGATSWTHDNTPTGIHDLCGNNWQWVPGLRNAGGELQVMPNNWAKGASGIALQSDDAWRAIHAQTGELLVPSHTGSWEESTYTPTTANSIRLSQSIEDVPANTIRHVGFDLFQMGKFPMNNISDAAISVLRIYGVLPVPGLTDELNTFYLGLRSQKDFPQHAIRGGSHHGTSTGLSIGAIMYGAGVAGYVARIAYVKPT